MATPKHSRFTDDVYCTPAPTAPKIQSKALETIRDEVFRNKAYDEFKQGLFAGEDLDARDLYHEYPPNFKDKNKQYIFDLLNKPEQYEPARGSRILMTRWKPFIPIIEERQNPTKIIHQWDLFDYKPDNDSQTVEWYLNFANSDLFAYYAGHLLAQDELQVLECVELAALREYLVQAEGKGGYRTIGSDAHTGKPVPTPILISNVERVIGLDTRQIYGNAFAKATPQQLDSAYHRQKPPQKVNLIAIEAPSYGEGRYTKDQIRFILTTCYTGFKAAQILAEKTHILNTGNAPTSRRDVRHGAPGVALSTVIHTGWWGCGAYGNNRVLMILTQILGAHWAQVNKVVFHLQTKDGHNQESVNQAEHHYDRLKNMTSVDEVIDEIFKLNLEWEKSNNT